MNEDRNMLKNEPAGHVNSGVNLFDYLSIIIRMRKFIILAVTGVTVLAIVISLSLPKWYKATTALLPPREQGLLSQFGSVGTLLKGLSSTQKISGVGENLGAYNYLAILNSRTAMEEVIRKFDLLKVYNIRGEDLEQAIKVLSENTSFEIQENDYITIDVYDQDPQRAADIANYFVEVLNRISIQLGTQEARSNREFIEKRLENSREGLHNAEEALRKYEEQSGIVIAPEQTTSSISAIAELYGLKAKKDVELAIMERSVTKDNEMLQQLKLELNELDKKLATYPQVGIESFRLYRDVAIQEKIIEFLVPMYEQAKIDEQKDVPVILVLDKAVPLEHKVKPKRAIIVLSAAVSALFLSILLVVLRERYNVFKRTRPDLYAKLQGMWRKSNAPLR